MKVIISGATGFIGKEVLNYALSQESISSVLCISRRALPEPISSNPKVKVIILEDFTSYPPDVLTQLEGAEACIWALGKPAFKSSDLELCRKIEVDFCHAAAKAFCSSLSPSLKKRRKTFRFVYLSGWGAERDTTKKLWMMRDTRTIKGEVENGLLDLQGKEGSNFEVSVARPFGVVSKDTLMPNMVIKCFDVIKVDTLAAAMVNEVVENLPGTRTYENKALRSIGENILNC